MTIATLQKPSPPPEAEPAAPPEAVQGGAAEPEWVPSDFVIGPYRLGSAFCPLGGGSLAVCFATNRDLRTFALNTVRANERAEIDAELADFDLTDLKTLQSTQSASLIQKEWSHTILKEKLAILDRTKMDKSATAEMRHQATVEVERAQKDLVQATSRANDIEKFLPEEQQRLRDHVDEVVLQVTSKTRDWACKEKQRILHELACELKSVLLKLFVANFVSYTDRKEELAQLGTDISREIIASIREEVT